MPPGVGTRSRLPGAVRAVSPSRVGIESRHLRGRPAGGDCRRNAERRALVLLLWWAAAGPALAWGKATLGPTARWVGCHISAERADRVDVEIPGKTVEELLAEVGELLLLPHVPLPRLQLSIIHT